MVRLFYFLVGFISGVFKMLIGSAIICAIVGFFFFPALYVLVPLFLIGTVVEAYKEGVERASDYLDDRRVIKNNRKANKQLKKLKRIFNEDELYEFDSAWKQMR